MIIENVFEFFIGYETFSIVSCSIRHLTAGLLYNDFVSSSGLELSQGSQLRWEEFSLAGGQNCVSYSVTLLKTCH